MNSRVTMGLAGLLFVAAIIVGYWGLVLSRQPAPIAESVVPPLAPPTVIEKTIANAEDQTRQPVVVRDMPPFIPLTAVDVALEKLRSTPAGSLKRGDQSNRPTLSGRTAKPRTWRHRALRCRHTAKRYLQ